MKAAQTEKSNRSCALSFDVRIALLSPIKPEI